MPERAPEEYVAACEAKGCCPLGAALGKPRKPMPSMVAHLIGVSLGKATAIAGAWDGDGDDDRPESIRLALAAGLRPLMDRYLFGESSHV